MTFVICIHLLRKMIIMGKTKAVAVRNEIGQVAS